MKYFVWHWVCVLALVAAPAAGCSSSDGDGGAGAGGAAGEAGMGGTAGMGGAAGMGGTAGAGGVATIRTGLWTGEGNEGPGAPWTICFSVNEAGDALTADPFECQSFAIQVDLAGCPNSIWYRPDIPIVEGSFSLTEPGAYDIQGTFDGDTASGEATFTMDGVDCTGQWQASPSM
ncbi:MAG: hypothetical protein OEN21_18895 [Myxococcales bacterium]|nr:hypothetical protein [Myxococcales bacterium]